MSREQSDHEFLSVLQRHAPATIQVLCEALGVTTTAVRQKLLRFQAEGLVSRELSKPALPKGDSGSGETVSAQLGDADVRQERGRPGYTYQLTAKGLRKIGDDHAEIAAILWQQIMRIGDVGVRQSVLNGVKDSLVQRFGDCSAGTSLASRLQVLTSRLAEEGFDLEFEYQAEPNALPILREHNCPYHELAAEDSSICDLEQSVFSELLGVPVELSACRLDGHACCEFQVGQLAGEAAG